MKNNHWILTPQLNQQFLILHIPKTAGTTFRKLITKHVNQDGLYPSNFHLFTNNDKYLPQKKLIENRKDLLKKPIIMGHYNVRLLPHLSENVKTIVFFRKPMDRILSHIKHILQKDPAYQDGDPNKVIEDKLDLLANLQSRIMGYNKRRPNMETVLENLSKMTFIGIQESFAESIAKLNEKLAWHLDYQEEVYNASSLEFAIPIRQENMDKIREAMQPDMELYEEALKRY